MKLEIGAMIKEPGNSLKNRKAGWRSFRPKWDNKKCIQCGLCWMYCPDIAIPQKNGKRINTNLDYCKGCLICKEVCPVKAISSDKEEH